MSKAVSVLGRVCGRRWISVKASELSLQPGTTLHDHVWSGLIKHGGYTAITCPQTRRSIKFEKLREISGSFAAWLSDNSPGPLTLLLPNSIEFAVSALGALEAGVPLSSLNPESSTEELSRSLAGSKSPWIVTSSSRVHNILEAKRSLEEKNKEEFPLGIIVIDDEIVFSGVLQLADLVETEGHVHKKNNVALLTEQWGPTGFEVKKVTEESLLASCLQAGWPGLGPGDRLAVCIPMFTQYGLSHGLFATLASGAELVLAAPGDLATCVKKHNVAAVSGVSGVLNDLQENLNNLSKVRKVTVGGPPAESWGPLARKVVQHYGPPEGPVTFRQAIPGGPARLGQPVEGTEAKIMVAGGEVGPMSEGKIWVRGPQFDGDWMCTGDFGYFDPEGTFYLTKKGTLSVRGIPVWPGELETVLERHEGVAAAAVFQSGQKLVASVVPSNPYQVPRDLKKWLASQTAPHKQISEVIFTSYIPLTPEGEPDRAKLSSLCTPSNDYVSLAAV